METTLSAIPVREYIPGYHGKMIHTERMTLAFWEVEKGARVPEHAHENEQIMHVQDGQFEFTVGGATKIYGPGDIVIIAPNVPHSGIALSACRIIDVFCPVREAYR